MVTIGDVTPVRYSSRRDPSLLSCEELRWHWLGCWRRQTPLSRLQRFWSANRRSSVHRPSSCNFSMFRSVTRSDLPYRRRFRDWGHRAWRQRVVPAGDTFGPGCFQSLMVPIIAWPIGPLPNAVRIDRVKSASCRSNCLSTKNPVCGSLRGSARL